MQLLFKRSTLENDRKFQWIAYGVVLVLATIIFRGPTAVLITAMAPALGIFWTLGCIRFFHLQDNPFNTVVVPVLLSMVGFTDGVHMMTQIRKHRSDGMSGREAALKAMNEVGTACFLTSLTTAIGFGSLGWAHHDIVQEFGWCCVLGVVVTFIAVIAAIPLACSTWLGRSVHHGHSKGLIESNVDQLTFLMRAVLRHPRWFAWTGIILTTLCILISLKLRPDERMMTAIPEGTPEAKALRHLDRVMGGLETSTVIIRWDPTISNDSKEVIAVTDEIEKVLRDEPLLGSPLGIATLLHALPGTGSASDKANLTELLPTQLKRAFLRSDDQRSTIVFRLQDIGIAKYGSVFQRVTDRIQSILQKHPGFRAELEGAAIWRWKNLYQIIVDLLTSLSSAALIIFVTLGIAYRSIRLGLISIVPNIFPLAITGAGMYWFGSPLELISVLAFTVCLGIAVDDTIHFLTRYTEERKLCRDNDEAIRRSFIGVGSACIMTTAVLTCGFATVLWSDTREHHIFATMGGATIVFALVGDLVFLPAMLAIFCRSDNATQ
jgi:predicted RND superfamily exporter protein